MRESAAAKDGQANSHCLRHALWLYRGHSLTSSSHGDSPTDATGDKFHLPAHGHATLDETRNTRNIRVGRHVVVTTAVGAVGGGARQASSPVFIRDGRSSRVSTALASISRDRSSRSGEARVTAQLTNLHDEPDRELAPVLDQLSRTVPVPPGAVSARVGAHRHERFRDAPVRTFTPLLGAYRRDGLAGSAAARAHGPRLRTTPDQR